jgi:sulfate adenylyltransferase subunit 2/3'(2'), 5'-bisphosphate nucleotidase
MTMVEQLVGLALEAGAEIMRIYGTDFAVRVKEDCSPVTEADEAAEAIILAGLARISPGLAVVAEEAAAAGCVPETSERFFLVDPLDGSREFISRNGEFTVNIALIEHGMPVFGIVYAPALQRIWWGQSGQGAWQGRVMAGAVVDLLPIGVRACSPAGLDVVGSRSHGGSAVDAWLERFAISRFVPAGSSLKFCLLACGEADLYPRLGRTMEWDTAAGDAVLRAAGGRVETLLGEQLRYGKRNQAEDADFANPHFVAYGDPALR